MNSKNSKISLAIFIILTLIILSVPVFNVIIHPPFVSIEIPIILVISYSTVAAFFNFYRWVPRATIVLFGFTACIAIVALIYIIVYQNVLSSNLIFLLFETDPQLTLSLFKLMPSYIWIFTFVFILAILFCFAFPFKLNKFPWSRYTLYSLSIFFLAMLFQYMENNSFHDSEVLLGDQNAFQYSWVDKDYVTREAFPLSIPFIIRDYYYGRKEMVAYADKNQNYSFNAMYHQDNPAEKHVYILVIGESSRADHWGINGYSRDTSPNLSARNDVISFRHMYTMYPFTRFAVPLIVSRKPIDLESDFFNQPSIITYFKQIGFDTAWIAMPAPFGKYDSPISVFASEANHIVFLNPDGINAQSMPDYKSVPYVMNLINSAQRNIFIVIHTLGAHLPYYQRYDEPMRLFKPDRFENREADIYSKADQEVLINSYDNTIVATDRLLGDLIQKLEALQVPSFIMYVSDHGQGLLDDGNYAAGHGYNSFATLHVAAFFWASPQYTAKNPEKIQNLQNNAATQLTSLNMVFDTLVSLSGGQIPDPRPQLDMTQTTLHASTQLVNLLKASNIHWQSNPPSKAEGSEVDIHH